MNTRKVLSSNGLAVPADFPISQFEAVHKKLIAYDQRSEYALAIGALHAISYRFTALAEYDDRFTASITAHGPGPGQPVRYEQERDVFGFFSNGFSVFDAFCFAMFAIGALTGSKEFPLSFDDDERKVNWNSMQRAYSSSFPGDPMLNVLQTISNDKAFTDFRDVRNILTHRAAPPRNFSVSAGSSKVPESATITRVNIALDAKTTSSRRRQVATLLLRGLDATQKFVETRL